MTDDFPAWGSGALISLVPRMTRSFFAALQHQLKLTSIRNLCQDGIRNCAPQQEAAMVKNSTVLIRKYENRRLYDTSTSRYINLDDVAAMVRNGSDVQVVDTK